MNKTTDWWCNYKPLSKRDKEILNVPRPNTAEDSTLKFYSAFKHLLQNIPLGQSLFNHNLYVEKEARTFINYLFDKYSDDETLLITSPMNHPCVVDNMNKFKNILQLHYHTTVLYSNLNQVKQYLINKIYKRAFIYLIGTHQTTGEITPSIFFEQLRDYLLSQNIEPIMVIDDVHGMYIIPRDYSIFDYVITTAHAIIRHFDMGMMFACCSSLISLNISSFNTTLVTNMDYMFNSCSLLKSLNLSYFNTSLVTNMHRMFESSSSLESVFNP